MAEALKQKCTDCGYVYDPQEHYDVDLVDRVNYECPGSGGGVCGAGIDKYEIVEPVSPLDDADEDESDGSRHSPVLTRSNEINAERSDKAVIELVRMAIDGELTLRPDWQRYYVWSGKQASQLVESLLLKLPIPLIYLAEEDDGSFSVVDGQQRLTAIYEFVSGKRVDPSKHSEVRLSGLEVLTDLNGKTFDELDAKVQKFLKYRELQVIRLKSDSDPNLKLKVFRRLNTGSVKLNAQELRNAAFSGPYNSALKKWAQNPTFLKMLRADGAPDIRMLDVELVLRFTAWCNRAWPALKSKNIAAFLDEEMEMGRTYSPRRLAQLEQSFRAAVELTWQTFGARAFRRYFPGTDPLEPGGEWEMRQPNKALYDVVMYGFTRKTKAQFWPHLEAIREALINLLASDVRFQDAITAGTTDPKRVHYRFDTWVNLLEEIVQDDAQERTFSHQLKVELFEADRACKICSQVIRDLDDAHVHHIEHYWRGGKTIPENAALVHRYCNLREGGGKK